MLVDAGNIVAKEVANPQHTPHPNDGAEHIIPDEFAKFHPAHAGNHRRKGPDNGNELRDHDCRASMFILKFVGADSMLLVEEEAVLPIEDPWTRRATDEITEGVAADRCEREDGRQLVYIQIPARGEQSGRNKEGIAG